LEGGRNKIGLSCLSINLGHKYGVTKKNNI